MDRDQKHICKFCGKGFPSGRSLGGHMRCHVPPPVAAASAAAAAVAEGKLEENRGPGYGLRENPKKTWRLSDPEAAAAAAMESSDGDLKRCRECGKGFQSWRALFGHMKCHSEKLAKTGQQEDDEEHQQRGGAWSVAGSHKKKRRSRRPGSGPASSSSASESCCYYSKEQEDVAISLMMLSRDTGYWGNGLGHFDESSDKNSTALSKNLEPDEGEFEENSDDLLKKKKKKKKKIGSDSELGFDPESMRSRYECDNCNKSFDTYQALGGHRASNKRLRGCFAPSTSESGAPIDQAVDGNGGGHQCLICGKVFGSGQALGGHKRSHLVMATPAAVAVRQEEEDDLIDLNVPAAAPVDEESSKGSVTVAAAGADEYGSWWARCNLGHDGMISMIAN